MGFKQEGHWGTCVRPKQWTPAAVSKLLGLCSMWFYGKTYIFLCDFIHHVKISSPAPPQKHNSPKYVTSVSDLLRAGRSGIESRLGRDIPPVQTSSGVHPASCKTGTGSFPGWSATNSDLCIRNMDAERKYNWETASLWEENLKRNIWAYERKSNMED